VADPSAVAEPSAVAHPSAAAPRAEEAPQAMSAATDSHERAESPAAAADGPPAESVGAPMPAAGVSAPAPRDLESLRSVWPAVVELVRGEHAMLGALIAEARPVAVDGEDLTLAFSSTAQFLKKKAEDPANRTAVGEALRALTGERWRLSYELRDEPAEQDRREPGEPTEEEWVRRLMEEFDAEEIPGEWRPGGEWEPGQGAPPAQDGEQAMTSNEKGS
jgi:hypothetical protein